MNVGLNLANFFGKYILDPMSEDLTETDRKIAALASVVLGVISLGLLHVGLYLFSITKVDSHKNQPTVNEVERSVEPVLRKRQSEVSESESTLCDPEIRPVLFYREQESWGIFSNYWKGNPLKFQGRSCATSEHLVKSKFLCKFTSFISVSCLGLLLTLGLQNSNSVDLPMTPKSPGR